jgi:hypothetical protein
MIHTRSLVLISGGSTQGAFAVRSPAMPPRDVYHKSRFFGNAGMDHVMLACVYAQITDMDSINDDDKQSRGMMTTTVSHEA